jgi:hypothetical protein
MTILFVLVFAFLLLLTAIQIGFTILSPIIIAVAAISATYVVGISIDSRISHNVFKYLLPTAAIVIPVTWGILSYNHFKSLCESTVNVKEMHLIKRPQDGFLTDDSNLIRFEGSKGLRIASDLYEEGVITYFDVVQTFGFGGSEPTISRRSKQSNNDAVNPTSNYMLRVAPIEKIESRWHAPLFKVSYELSAKDKSQPTKRQSEYVFGGGLIGFYMHAFLGERGDYSDKDFKFLSCGYASRKPAAWRPRFSSNPNSANYHRADRDFLRDILP